MSNLRSSLIRLAHANPALRADLLPLLREAGCEKLPEGGMRDNCEKKVEEGKDKPEKEAAPPAKLKGKKLDKAIEKAYYHHGSGIQIDMMSIPKIFREGVKAYQDAATVEEAEKALDEAMKAAVVKYRVS